ncbi:histidine phosphatase family protein [Paenibacillus endoradicis]|uniref:histidine phosphatase family protein n=1 Tax=Paenibacillus endoradicis TaxID=2972487 RepID=UPI002159366A|nr:histidine phosphatase family protein [Paenibacillus endoradicis]MCR8656690.1 histidine phosphatase family protein [Paenibacillus endoradicis]
MKVGLVRHFSVVDITKALWMTSSEFNSWVEYYDQCDIKSDEFIEKIYWDLCYSSDQPRSVKTAELIFKDKIITTNLLREIHIKAILQTKFKLHRSFWLILGRVGWLLNHSTQESKQDTILRAKRVIDEIELNDNSNILVVTHGAFMTVLSKELKRRGYIGDNFLRPLNGKVYLFERDF